MGAKRGVSGAYAKHQHTMRVTLVSYHGALGDAARECGWGGIDVLNYTDVREVPQLPGTAFVSPANSLGFMDGGIDYSWWNTSLKHTRPMIIFLSSMSLTRLSQIIVK